MECSFVIRTVHKIRSRILWFWIEKWKMKWYLPFLKIVIFYKVHKTTWVWSSVVQNDYLTTKMTPFGSSKAFIFSSVNYDIPHLRCLPLDWSMLLALPSSFIGYYKRYYLDITQWRKMKTHGIYVTYSKVHTKKWNIQENKTVILFLLCGFFEPKKVIMPPLKLFHRAP